MNFKFSVKQLILIIVIACAITIPRYPRYLSLDTHSQLRVSLIYAICLIIAWAAVVRLVYDHLKNERENLEEDNKLLYNNKNEILENDFNGCYEDVSIDNKIALIQRLRELKCWKFEEVVEMLFKFKWYKIEKWPNYYWDLPQVDWWKDLIMLKDNKIYNVQIKKYYTDPVKLTDIKCFKCDIWEESWYFVTTSIFSPKAKKLANEKWINCVEYNDLLCVISKLPDKNKKIIQNFINDENNIDKTAHPKTCKKCWAPINDRNWWYCLRNRYPRSNEKQCICREFYK